MTARLGSRRQIGRAPASSSPCLRPMVRCRKRRGRTARPPAGRWHARDRGPPIYLLLTRAAPDGTWVVAGADLQSIDASQAALARLLIGVGLSVGAASLLGGWLLAGRALRPVDRLIEDAASVGPSTLDGRLSAPARMDEIGRLTQTLNGMLDRIAESVERQRLFVAMASHELRTPARGAASGAGRRGPRRHQSRRVSTGRSGCPGRRDRSQQPCDQPARARRQPGRRPAGRAAPGPPARGRLRPSPETSIHWSTSRVRRSRRDRSRCGGPGRPSSS